MRLRVQITFLMRFGSDIVPNMRHIALTKKKSKWTGHYVEKSAQRSILRLGCRCNSARINRGIAIAVGKKELWPRVSSWQKLYTHTGRKDGDTIGERALISIESFIGDFDLVGLAAERTVPLSLRRNRWATTEPRTPIKQLKPPCVLLSIGDGGAFAITDDGYLDVRFSRHQKIKNDSSGINH